MRGILINPTLQTISETDLPDHVFLLQGAINKALECQSTVGITDESDTVQLISDAQSFNRNHLGMFIDGFPCPLFGNILILGWSKTYQQSVSLPAWVSTDTFEVTFLDEEQTKKTLEQTKDTAKNRIEAKTSLQ